MGEIPRVEGIEMGQESLNEKIGFEKHQQEV